MNIVPPAIGASLGVGFSDHTLISLEMAGSPKIDLPTGPRAWVSSRTSSVDFRYFPYHGSFLLGFGLGMRRIQVGVDSLYVAPRLGADAEIPIFEPVAIPWVADLHQTYANYRIGWLWRMSQSSGIGLELGTTSAFRSSLTMTSKTSDVEINQSDKQQMQKSRTDEINNLLVNKTLPLMALSIVWVIK